MGVDKRIRTEYKDIEGVRLNYTVENDYGKPVKQVRIDLLQNETKFGGITVDSDGKLYIPFDKGDILASYESQNTVISQALIDVHAYFNESITV